MLGRMRLKRGIPVDRATVQLDDVIQMARNSTLARDLDAVPYVSWVYSVERALQSAFVDVPLQRLHTERFWRVQGPTIRRAEAISQEVELQVAWLSSVRDTITTMAERFRRQPGAIAVLDTNVLLHHRPLKDVDWGKIVGEKPVLLVIPRRVVEELDARKYVGTKLGDRARKRIRLLSDHVAPGGEKVRPAVTVQILGPVDLDPDVARRAPIPADEEIIETCEALTSYVDPNRVHLLTGDLSMSMLAENRGLSVRRMPDDVVQPVGDERE